MRNQSVNEFDKSGWQLASSSVVTKSFIALLSIALVAIISCCVVAFATSSAFGDEEGETVEQFSLNVNKTGESAGVASLDKVVYNSGDDAVLTWKGAVSGNNFIIPVSIKYNNTTLSVSQLLDASSFQSANSEYYRKMKQYAVATEFSAFQSYITKEHKLTISKPTADTTITVEFAKVAPVYRLYNSITSEHLFSTNKTEYDGWVEKCKKDKDAWIGEGISWLAPTTSTGTKAVHRLYNAALGAMGKSSHYYSADEKEIKSLTTKAGGWKDEGSTYQFKSGGTQAIYTCYNEALGSAHHYTSSKTEWQNLSKYGWDIETKKNGTNGVFQGILATSWSFTNSYYKVEHQLQNANGTYSTYETQFVAGKSGSKTAAVAKTYPGYTAGSVTQKNISSANSTTVVIKYNVAKHTVTFDGSGHEIVTEPQSVAFGGKVVAPTDAESRGYTLLGWYWDPNFEYEYNFNTLMPNSDMTLYSKWQANTYTVAFDANTGVGTVNDQTLVYDAETKLNANVFTKVGYIYDGWNTEADGSGTIIEDEALTPNIIGSGKITLYAQWKPIQYHIAFDSDCGDKATGSVATMDVNYDQTTNLPLQLDETSDNRFVRVGYKFTGWATASGDLFAYEDGAEVFNWSKKDGDTITLYAMWEAISYTLSFEPGADNVVGTVDSITLNYDETKILPDQSSLAEKRFTRASYTFKGWSCASHPELGDIIPNCTKITNLSSVEGDNIVFTALWEPITYKLFFDANGGDSGATDPQEITFDEPFKLNKNGYTRVGYKFLGWAETKDATAIDYTDEQEISKNLESVQDAEHKFYAVWSPLTYTVSYDRNVNISDGGDSKKMYDKTYTYDKPESLSANVWSRVGYTFMYWCTSADGNGPHYENMQTCPNIVDPNVTKNVTLYAIWRPNIYTVIFDGNGYDVQLDSQVMTYGNRDADARLAAVPDAVKAKDYVPGYTLGKYVGDNGEIITDPDKQSTANFICWTAKTYDGKNIELQDQAINADWCKDDNDSITLNAIWTPNTDTKYTIRHLRETVDGNYDPENAQLAEIVCDDTTKGTTDTVTNVAGNDSLLKTYDGWTVQKSMINEKTIAGDGSTVIDVFYTRNQYTVNFDLNYTNAPAVSSQTIQHEYTFDEPSPEPVRTGYTFGGWYKSANCNDDEKWNFDTDKMPIGGLTLYAKWTPNTYTIKYHYKTYEAAYDTTTKFLQQTTLNYTTYGKDGYDFAGWSMTPTDDVKFPASSLTGALIIGSTSGFDGTQSTYDLYAVWTPHTYTIVLNGNGGTYTNNNVTYTTIEKPGYTYGEDKELPSMSSEASGNKFTRKGYKFIGWATSATGNVVYKNGQMVNSLTPVNGDTVNLYAKWEAITYKVNYHPNGGDGNMTSTTLTYDQIQNLSACAFTAPASKTFNGWCLTDKGNPITTSAGVPSTGKALNLTEKDGYEVTVYALWK